VGFAELGGYDMTLVLCAVLGGAMFGDNLSFISDTTIAATQGAGCAMKDKFRMNFLIALPAAIFAIVMYAILGAGRGGDHRRGGRA
jgi:Na+/H+ antiporter NhaC